MYPTSWAAAEALMRKLISDGGQRGVVRARLLPLAVERRLEYFQDEDASVLSGLLTLAGSGDGFHSSVYFLFRWQSAAVRAFGRHPALCMQVSLLPQQADVMLDMLGV